MSSPSPTPKPILLLGGGELGTAILHALLAHPSYTPTLTPLTLLLRPSTLASPSPPRAAELAAWRARGVSLTAADLETAPVADLAALFARFDTVVHAGGMLAPAGTQERVTRAALDAKVRRYMPWQAGVDYDVLGPRAGQGLFAEQCAVRAALRAQRETRWVVVSCGVFMSFLFEEAWGVVRPEEDEGTKKVRVRALGSWEDGITVTAVRDIGRVCAALMLEEAQDGEWGKPVFIAGETLTYGELAELVARVSGKEVVRELWDRDMLKAQMDQNPDDKLWSYRAVFGGGVGVSWPVTGTWSEKRGMEMERVEEWLSKDWSMSR